MPIATGTLIDGRYKIENRIGQGGMAEVFLATDIISKKSVAIKVIKLDVMDNPVNLKRFQNETTIAASLNHPNIIKVLDQGTFDNRPYIVQEYISGQNLKLILDSRGMFPISEAVDCMLQLLGALNYAHQHNVVHRDIKPDNIFLLSNGTLKLGDFGIAIADTLDIKQTVNSDKIVGSVCYMAPEIATGGLATNLSDIYSAGITFFELVTGRVPFSKENAVETVVAQIHDKFPSPKKINPNISKDIEKIIFKATMKKPGDRYQTVKEFYDDLFFVKINGTKDVKKGMLSRIFGFKS